MGRLAYEAYRLGRKFCRLPGLRAMIPGRLRDVVQGRLMARVIDRIPDRRYMEEVLLPAMSGLRPGRMLDVGVAEYTRHYGRWFPPECEPPD